ncbi:MAG: hypothetical protein AB3K77_02040 [Methanosarcinaceae archaeon]|uniref:hypothetical protein n=1 Tax=Methanosarcina sp. MTP4 TaxID=1434100 RepID=UPI000A57F599|nr:hypothetical protein [Methanosarcina sp. MTP4]
MPIDTFIPSGTPFTFSFISSNTRITAPKRAKKGNPEPKETVLGDGVKRKGRTKRAGLEEKYGRFLLRFG